MAAPKLTSDYISAKLDELPTLPSIVYELSKVINDPMSSTSDVERIMANDLSLTARVLRLVNSSYYAIPGGVSSLSRAIAYIGFETVNQLVLSASILKALEVKGPTSFDLNAFWRHSIGVAISAETIAKFVRHPTPADLFTCGLVHDMGKVALYTFAADLVVQSVRLAESDQTTYLEAEAKLGLPSHIEIGQQLALKWTLPIPLQAAIQFHHEKKGLRRQLTAELNRDVDIVVLANLLTHALKYGNSGHQKILGAPKELLDRLTINGDEFKRLVQDIKIGMDKASDFLRVLGGAL
jgi:HD-like signal output (HDOD) protein